MAQGTPAPHTPEQFRLEEASPPSTLPGSSPEALQELLNTPESQSLNSHIYDEFTKHWTGEDWKREDERLAKLRDMWQKREDERCANLGPQPTKVKTPEPTKVKTPEPPKVKTPEPDKAKWPSSESVWAIVGYRPIPTPCSQSSNWDPRMPKSWRSPERAKPAHPMPDAPKGEDQPHSPRGFKRPLLEEPWQSFAFVPRFRHVDLLSDAEYEQYANEQESYSQRRPWFNRYP